MRETLLINNDTFDNWEYQKVMISNVLYLREMVFFERSLTQKQRESEFQQVAEAYHEYLLTRFSDEEYARHLLERQIKTEDDFYNYLFTFYTKYVFYEKQGKLDFDFYKKIKKNTSKLFRRHIYESIQALNTTDEVEIMRHAYDRLFTEFNKGMRDSFLTQNMKTTRDFINAVKYVLMFQDEFEEEESGGIAW